LPYQNSLSTKERSYLDDSLQMENLCITKCSIYAEQCQQPELKSFFSDHIKAKRQHANEIKRLLGLSSTQMS